MNIPDFSNNKRAGVWCELTCAQYFTSLGYTVSAPIGNIGTYDLLVDDGESISKVQCKMCNYAVKKTGLYSINLTLNWLKEGGKVRVRRRYERRDFDYLWAATPNGFYLFPPDVVFPKTKTGRPRPRITISPGYEIYAVNPIQIETVKTVRTLKGYHAHMTQVQKDEIILLSEQKVPHQEIADRMGVTYNTIAKFLYRRRSGKPSRVRPDSH